MSVVTVKISPRFKGFRRSSSVSVSLDWLVCWWWNAGRSLGAAGLGTDEGLGQSTFDCQFAPATPLSTLTAGLGAADHCPHFSDKEPELEMAGYLEI